MEASHNNPKVTPAVENKPQTELRISSMPGVVFGTIVIIGGTIGTILLYTRVGYISLACAAGGLTLGGALITTSVKRVAKTNLEKSKSPQKESPPPLPRMEISLPVGGGLYSKQQWEKLGVEFVDEILDDSVRYVKAKLPEGWRKTIGSRARFYFILDEKGKPIVEMYYKKTDLSTAKVRMLSEQEQEQIINKIEEIQLDILVKMTLTDYYKLCRQTEENPTVKIVLESYVQKVKELAEKNPKFKNKLPKELTNP